MPAPDSFELDRKLIRRRFARAAATCGEAAVLAREVARRMDERLDYIRIEPRRILDVGCGDGTDLERLAQRYPAAQRVGVDFALPMLERVAKNHNGLLSRLLRRHPPSPLLAGADACALPFGHASFSLAWSNLMLNWLTDPAPALAEFHRVLEVGGLLMFSTLGPDTLRELRNALPDHYGERVHRFIDMHDIGDALIKAGFADPVMDMEVLTLTYATIDDLLRDLRLSGCTNASTARPRGLAGKAGWHAARAALEGLRQDARLPITFEVVQGHAWKAAPKTIADGRSVVHFQPRAGKA
ncbi:MAG: methyltransferase domain-containing protein [Rhodocyclales bacterium]|nr:methyltransferase domain-containing protein [Rhodocyclales bacterium]